MKKQGLKIDNNNGFTTHVLRLFINFYDIKNNEKYCYSHKIGNHSYETYSQALIDFIISEIKKNPNKFVESLKR